MTHAKRLDSLLGTAFDIAERLRGEVVGHTGELNLLLDVEKTQRDDPPSDDRNADLRRSKDRIAGERIELERAERLFLLSLGVVARTVNASRPVFDFAPVEESLNANTDRIRDIELKHGNQLGAIASRLSGLEEALAPIERKVSALAEAEARGTSIRADLHAIRANTACLESPLNRMESRALPEIQRLLAGIRESLPSLPETAAADEATLDRDRSEDAAAPPHFAPAPPGGITDFPGFRDEVHRRVDEAWAKAERGEVPTDDDHKAVVVKHIVDRYGGVKWCPGTKGKPCGYPLIPAAPAQCLSCRKQAENLPQPSPDASDRPIPTRGRAEAVEALEAAESAMREAERAWTENPVGETERAMARAQDAVSEARNAVEAYGPRRAKCVQCGQMFSADLGVRGWCPACRCEPEHAPPEADADR